MESQQQNFDLVFLGGGLASYVGSIKCAKMGKKVAIIDDSQYQDRSCVSIQSKFMYEQSIQYEISKQFHQTYGKEFHMNFDQKLMVKKKDELVKLYINGHLSKLKQNNVEMIQGKGNISNQNELTVQLQNGGTQKVQCKNIVLDVGCYHAKCPSFKYDGKLVCNLEQAINLEFIPKRVVVIGSYYIGLEISQHFNRLGSEVTLVDSADKMCSRFDKLVSDELLNIYQGQGMNVLLEQQVVEVKYKENSVDIVMSKNGVQSFWEADLVVMTAGFTPKTKNIGLEQIGVQLNSKGYIKINKNLQTSVDNIYALGDATDYGPKLSHKSVDQALFLIDFLYNLNPLPLKSDNIPQAVYTYPEVAMVGLTEHDAHHEKIQYVVGIFQFKNNERANITGKTQGFVKVLVCKSHRTFIGLHIVGPEAISQIQQGVLAMGCMQKDQNGVLIGGITADQFINQSQCHPGYGNAIKRALMNAVEKLPPLHLHQ